MFMCVWEKCIKLIVSCFTILKHFADFTYCRLFLERNYRDKRGTAVYFSYLYFSLDTLLADTHRPKFNLIIYFTHHRMRGWSRTLRRFWHFCNMHVWRLTSSIWHIKLITKRSCRSHFVAQSVHRGCTTLVPGTCSFINKWGSGLAALSWLLLFKNVFI